ELNAERFLRDPWAALSGTELYRTGDHARYSQGELEFLGRSDQQVKIRGMRVELGEIDAAVLEHSDVRSAATDYRPQNGRNRLITYLVSKDSSELRPSQLEAHLRRLLPDHMIPSAFVFVDELPRTPSGKLDRSRLPDLRSAD